MDQYRNKSEKSRTCQPAVLYLCIYFFTLQAIRKPLLFKPCVTGKILHVCHSLSARQRRTTSTFTRDAVGKLSVFFVCVSCFWSGIKLTFANRRWNNDLIQIEKWMFFALIQLMPKIRKFLHFTFFFTEKGESYIGMREPVGENAQRMIQLIFLAETLPCVIHWFITFSQL